MNSADTNDINRGIERVPYRLAMMIGGENYSLVIANPDATGYHLENSYPLGLPIDMVSFIHQHCRCAFCNAAISRDLRRCSCGEPTTPMHLQAECPADIYLSVFKPLLNRENSRIKHFKRKQRTEANGGSYTKNDIATLFQLQKGRCHFCGEPFSSNASGYSYHIDHFEPIYKGGRNDPSNLVLACPTCNLRKGAMGGGSFKGVAKNKAKKKRTPAMERKLGKIRETLTSIRAKYQGPNNNDEHEV